MRYFSLINNSGETLDITTKKVFFTEVSGLGFEEDTSFRQVGMTWWLNTVSYRQTPISGKIIFTDYDGADPYESFFRFAMFIQNAPLELVYHPRGLDGPEYRKRVRVSKLTKSELDIYGTLNEDLEFTPYTPWYESIVRNSISSDKSTYKGKWIWGKNGVYPPVIWAPTPPDATPTRFGSDSAYWVSADIPQCKDSPAKLIIFGPVDNPSWTHYVNGEAVSAGGFTQDVSIADGEALVIDNTTEIFQITVREVDYGDGEGSPKLGAVRRDLYQRRNFNNDCFILLRPGNNRIVVSSSREDAVKLRLEGHIYNATV
jgi:hypothetical protein